MLLANKKWSHRCSIGSLTTSCLCVELPYLWQKGWTEAGDFCGFGYSRGRSASLLLRRPYLVTPPDGMRGLGLGRRGVVCML